MRYLFPPQECHFRCVYVCSLEVRCYCRISWYPYLNLNFREPAHYLSIVPQAMRWTPGAMITFFKFDNVFLGTNKFKFWSRTLCRQQSGIDGNASLRTWVSVFHRDLFQLLNCLGLCIVTIRLRYIVRYDVIYIYIFSRRNRYTAICTYRPMYHR